MKKYWVVQKVIAFFPIDDVVHVLWVWHECQMFTHVLLLTLNLKIKKKVDASQRSSFAIMIRTWRILKSIFAIFCFINSKKGRKQRKLKQRKLRRVYDRNVVKKKCQNWFARFRDGDFSVKDAHHFGRPSKIDDNEMKVLQAFNGLEACYRSKSDAHWKCSWPFEIARLHKEARCLGTAWVERNSSDESHERLRSTHQTRRKRSVLEVYDHGQKWMFITISTEKEVEVGEMKHRKGKQRRSSIKRT